MSPFAALHADLRDRVLADDPRLDGLRSGARISLGCALVVAALVVMKQGFGTVMLAASMTMVAALAVKEAPAREQAITFAVLPLAAAPLFGLGVVVAHIWWVSGLIFAALLTIGVGLARLGPRFTAAMTLGPIAYFFALFFRPHVEDLPGDAFALVVGVGVAALLRLTVFADSDARTRRTNLRALPSAVIVVLQRAAAMLREPRRRRRRALVEAREDQNAIALTLDGLDVQLRGPVLDVEVAVAVLVSGARAALPGDTATREALAIRFEQIVAAIRQGTPSVDDAGLVAALARVTALRDVPALLPPPKPSPPPSSSSSSSALHPDTRRALQVGLAGVLSLYAGWLVSEVRWPWALLTTSVVFVSGATRAETGLRGAQRIAGTIGGVLVGVGLGFVVADHPRVELALIFALLFLSFAMLRLGYAWSVLWLTALLSVLYRFTNQPVDDLLELRLAETVVGAAIGVAVSMLVLPSSTRDQLRTTVGTVFSQLAGVLDDGPVRHEALRELDRAVVDLRTRSRPLALTSRRMARRVSALVDAVDNLAEAARPLTARALTGREERAAALSLRARARLLADAAAAADHAVTDVSALADTLVLSAASSTSLSPTMRALDRVDEALSRVGRAAVGMGFVAVPPTPPSSSRSDVDPAPSVA